MVISEKFTLTKEVNINNYDISKVFIAYGGIDSEIEIVYNEDVVIGTEYLFSINVMFSNKQADLNITMGGVEIYNSTIKKVPLLSGNGSIVKQETFTISEQITAINDNSLVINYKLNDSVLVTGGYALNEV